MIRLVLLFCSLAFSVERTRQDVDRLVGRKGDQTHLYDLYRRAPVVSLVEMGGKCDGTTNDSASFAQAIDSADGGGTVVLPVGVCVVSAINLAGKNDLQILGQGPGSVIRGRSAGGTAVITLGDAAHVSASRRIRLSDFYVDAAGTYAYGIRSLWMTDSKFFNVHIIGGSSNFATAALYLDYSWDNQFYSTRIESIRPVVMGTDNVNTTSFFGGRFFSTNTASGVSVLLRGQGNAFYSADIAGGKHAVTPGQTRGCGVFNCYMEAGNGTADTAIAFGVESGNSDAFRVEGCYFASWHAGVGARGSAGHRGVAFRNNYFKDMTTAFAMSSHLENPVYEGNWFDAVTNQFSTTLSAVSVIHGHEYRQTFNHRAWHTRRLGAVSGTVVLGTLANLTAGNPAMLDLHFVGRDSASSTRSARAYVNITDAGAVGDVNILDLRATTMTGFSVAGDTLKVDGLAASNWNVFLESRIWE